MFCTYLLMVLLYCLNIYYKGINTFTLDCTLGCMFKFHSYSFYWGNCYSSSLIIKYLQTTGVYSTFKNLISIVYFEWHKNHVNNIKIPDRKIKTKLPPPSSLYCIYACYGWLAFQRIKTLIFLFHQSFALKKYMHLRLDEAQPLVLRERSVHTLHGKSALNSHQYLQKYLQPGQPLPSLPW